MSTRRITRGLAGLILAAPVLACSGEPGRGMGIRTARATAAPTIVFHMTGLLVIVPPAADSSTTAVLIPAGGAHQPVLGFGIAGDVTGLCRMDAAFGKPAFDAGICYVDLREWSLQPFGDGAPRTSAWKLPSSTVNVSELVGNRQVPQKGLAQSSVTFTAGWVGPNTCSLADWTFTPVDAAGSPQAPMTRSLANVVDWEIVNPTEKRLTFINRYGTTKTVDLPGPNADNRIELLLANIPGGDLQDLPPGAGRALGGTVEAPDFDNYYNILRNPKKPDEPIPGRPKPVGRQTAVRPCAVNITLGKKLAPSPGRGVGTYGCMPVTG